jgi:hypothetical protein
MSVLAPPRGGSLVAIVSLGIVLVGAAASAVLMQQALSARPPTGYQVPIVNLARQFGLAPARPVLGGIGQPRNFPPGGGGGQFAAAAQSLGVSPEQLQVELSSASLTDIAIAHGADPDAVAAAMKTASDQQVDDAVSSGRLASDQAAARKAQAEDRVDQLMTQVAPFGGGPQRGQRRP